MLERDPRLCSGLLWKELFLRLDELAGGGACPALMSRGLSYLQQT